MGCRFLQGRGASVENTEGWPTQVPPKPFPGALPFFERQAPSVVKPPLLVELALMHHPLTPRAKTTAAGLQHLWPRQ